MATKQDSTTHALADAAVCIAQAGARNYLMAHNLTADPEELGECLKSWLHLKLPEALTDAKEAFACNMIQAGVATFTASIMQAGIEAAKECGLPDSGNAGCDRCGIDDRLPGSRLCAYCQGQQVELTQVS